MRRHSKGRRAVVILLTDGQMGNGAEIVSMFTGSPAAAVHTFGIDTTVNDAFLKQLARKTGGECWLLTPDDDVAGTVASLGHRLRRPVLTALGADKNWEVGSGFIPDLFGGQASHVSLCNSSIRERVEVSAKTSAGKKKAIPLNLTVSSNPALRLIWGRDRIAVLIDAGDGKAAIALAKEFNLLCEGASFVAWDEAEKVAIAEQEMYQPSQEIDYLMCASSAIHCAPLFAPKSRKMASPRVVLDSDETSCSYFEARIGEGEFASQSKLTWLGEVTEFFATHRPSWFAVDPDSIVPPLVSVYMGGEMSAWIRAILQKRRTPTGLAELLISWLEAQFGIPMETGLVRDKEFVGWILRSADAGLDDASLARQTRELLESRPPAAAAELRKLRRMLDTWAVKVAGIRADPPLI